MANLFYTLDYQEERIEIYDTGVVAVREITQQYINSIVEAYISNSNNRYMQYPTTYPYMAMRALTTLLKAKVTSYTGPKLNKKGIVY